jgi:hypothetical protein
MMRLGVVGIVVLAAVCKASNIDRDSLPKCPKNTFVRCVFEHGFCSVFPYLNNKHPLLLQYSLVGARTVRTLVEF